MIDIWNLIFATITMGATIYWQGLKALIKATVQKTLTADKPPQDLRPKELRNSWHARARGVFLGIAAIAGLLAAIDQLWGRPWPTAPQFSPGAPSFSLSLDVPFTVTNKSIFAIKNLAIACHVIDARLTVSQKSLRNVLVGLKIQTSDPKRPMELVTTKLEATGVSSYTCSVTGGPIGNFGPTPEFPDDKLSSAVIEFLTEYDSPWPWGGRMRSSSGVFTLNTKVNPQQWTHGIPLQF